MCTRDYRLSHDKEPSGRGSWAFFFNDNTRIESVWWPNVKHPDGGPPTYAQARKAAVEEANRRGASRVEVGS